MPIDDERPADDRRSVPYLLQRRIGAFDQLRPQRWNWEFIKRPLDRTLQQHATEPITHDQIYSLRFFWLDGIFSATSEAFYLSFIPLFALAFGATNQEVGWITAVGNLMGAIALFPGARLTEKTGKRKQIVLWTGGGIGRVMLLMLAMVPLFNLPPTMAIVAITALNGIRAFMANFCNPAWTAMVAEIVPNFMRGRYFSTRNLTMGIATLAFTAIAGWLITSGNTWTAASYLGFQLAFLLAFATGMLSTYSFSRIIEPEPANKDAASNDKGSLRRSLRAGRGFFGFVISGFVWSFALQVAAPFFNVYLVKDLGGNSSVVGIMASISSLSALAGQVYFGRRLDRKGAIWMQLVTGFPITLLPVAWIFYTEPWQVGLNNLFGGFLWAGYNLANFNLLLQLTPLRGRANAVALYQTAVFTSAVLGPLVGGYLADNISYYATFGLSGLGRLIGMLLFVWLTVLPLRQLARRSPMGQTI